ncbi:MAG: translation initiation factor Sui1 [Gemmatimonadales bacterium]
MKKPPSGGLVYSTSHGRMCPHCRHPAEDCRCRAAAPPPGDGVIRVGRETKGRKGAGVTIIRGVPLAGDELVKLAGTLKRLCGAGGTVHEGTIEIQGDHRDKVIAALTRPGWTIKRVGG